MSCHTNKCYFSAFYKASGKARPAGNVEYIAKGRNAVQKPCRTRPSGDHRMSQNRVALLANILDIRGGARLEVTLICETGH